MDMLRTDIAMADMPEEPASSAGAVAATIPVPNVPSISMSEACLPPYTFAKRFRIALENLAVLSASSIDPVGILVTDKTPPNALMEIRRFVARPVRFHKVEEETLNAALVAIYERKSSDAMEAVEQADQSLDLERLAQSIPETEDLLAQDDDSPIIRLINALLTQALREEASDIHVETFEQRIAVRFRVDGELRKVLEPKRVLAQLLVSRIKVMAKLDIAEKRVPQDGRISLRIGGRDVDVRVSTIPTRHGERVVMRLLDKGTGRLDLSILGMTDNDLARFENILAQPHGVILVTGPTGSGKSTSLYAGLSALNDGSRNILTIEDPVEYDLEGIGQMQVNTKAGMTFAKGLRAILRQDPDIVMIGEIRDGETADIAIQASLTGHLLLSTLHTNTAVGSITRLIDMGVEPFLVSSSLLAMIAQRLVRKLCPQCKEPYSPDAATRQRLRCDLHEQLTFYHAKGCEHCYQHGYKGRTGIYEIVRVTDDLRTLIHTRASEQELSLCARKTSADIFSDGVCKVKAGITSVDELLRVVHAN